MLGSKIFNRIKQTEEKYSDYLYSIQLLTMIPSLNKEIFQPDEALQKLGLLDKVANTTRFKRFRARTASTYVDIARNAISLKHSEIVSIFEHALKVSPMDDKSVLQNFIIYEFNYGFDDAYLRQLIGQYFSRFNKWDKDEKNKLIHVINIALKLLNGEKNSARNWLSGYVKEYQLSGLQQIPLVSYFAFNEGHDNEKIRQAAYIAGEVLRTRQDGLFTRYLQNKKVMIVGNGPQNIGTGYGAQIDKFEVVVRFNNGVGVQKFSKDYGRKTTVWVRNNAAPYGNFKNLKGMKFCILVDSIERLHWKDEQIGKCYNELIKSKCRLIAPERKFLQQIFKKYDFSRFTSGLLAIAYIVSLSEGSKISICGFSSADKKLSECDSFYGQQKLSFYSDKSSNREAGFLNHSFEMEKLLMGDLLEAIGG